MARSQTNSVSAVASAASCQRQGFRISYLVSAGRHSRRIGKKGKLRNGRYYRHGGPSTGPRTPEGLQRIVKARTVHGTYGAEMRELRRLMRALDEKQRRVLELVK